MTKEIKNFISYLKDLGYQSENTLMAYQRDLTHLQNYLTIYKIDNFSTVTENMLHQYVNYLVEKGTATSSISRCTATIHHFFEYLLSQNQITKDPATNLKAPRIESKIPEILTESEIERLLNAPKGLHPKAIRDRAILHVLYETGFRVSELISLQVRDLDLKNRRIVCENDTRSIPISYQTVEILTTYLQNARATFQKQSGATELFLNGSGKRLSRQGIWKLVKFYGKEANLPIEVTPHILRHSFAVHSLRKGMSLHMLSRILGHSDCSTTRIYKKLI